MIFKWALASAEQAKAVVQGQCTKPAFLCPAGCSASASMPLQDGKIYSPIIYCTQSLKMEAEGERRVSLPLGLRPEPGSFIWRKLLPALWLHASHRQCGCRREVLGARCPVPFRSQTGPRRWWLRAWSNPSAQVAVVVLAAIPQRRKGVLNTNHRLLGEGRDVRERDCFGLLKILLPQFWWKIAVSSPQSLLFPYSDFWAHLFSFIVVFWLGLCYREDQGKQDPENAPVQMKGGECSKGVWWTPERS